MNWLIENVSRKNVFNNCYGLGRSLIAFGTLSTLLFNRPSYLFPYGKIEGIASPQSYDSLLEMLSIFKLFGYENANLARLLCIFILILVIIGWRPRFTGFLHFWVSYSVFISVLPINGGDQVSMILTLLLIPVCLLDSRRNHWEGTGEQNHAITLPNRFKNVTAVTFMNVIRIQVAVIYLIAAVAKFKVPEWINGTALYYWINHSMFGSSGLVNSLLSPFIQNGVVISLMTWGVLAFELILFSGLLMEKRYRKPLMFLGFLFHFSIVIIHGLFSFFFAMAGALVLYLGPIYEGFDMQTTKEQLNGFKRKFRYSQP